MVMVMVVEVKILILALLQHSTRRASVVITAAGG